MWTEQKLFMFTVFVLNLNVALPPHEAVTGCLACYCLLLYVSWTWVLNDFFGLVWALNYRTELISVSSLDPSWHEFELFIFNVLSLWLVLSQLLPLATPTGLGALGKACVWEELLLWLLTFDGIPDFKDVTENRKDSFWCEWFEWIKGIMEGQRGRKGIVQMAPWWGSVWQLLACISSDQETTGRKQGQAVQPYLVVPMTHFLLLGPPFWRSTVSWNSAAS